VPRLLAKLHDTADMLLHGEVEIADDGKGFDPQEADRGNGIGLMRERAARYDGSFRLTSVPGRGTTVEFSLRLR
jgi:signal transduction histidine kinase